MARRKPPERSKPKPIEERSDAELALVEACELLDLNPNRLSASDRLKCDLVSTLRLVIDNAGEAVLEGGTVDLGRLITAVEQLAKLLPAHQLEPPQRDDPRQALLDIFNTMAERRAGNEQGYLGLERKVARLQRENAALRARLAGKTPADDTPVPTLVESVPVPAPAAGNVVPLPRPPPGWVNGLSDVPESVRDTRPRNEPWRAFYGDNSRWEV